MNFVGKLPALNFAKNHRGSEDVAMFDFTSLYSSKCSVGSSNVKRSEPIQKLADNLMGCASFTNTSAIATAKKEPVLASEHPGWQAENINPIGKSNEGKEEDSMKYTRRPVDRLNLELSKMDKISFGTNRDELPLNSEKDRRVQRLAEKIAKNGIDESEKNLENTGTRMVLKGKEHMIGQDDKSSAPESAPSAPPKKLKATAKDRDAVVLRPVAPVQPKRHFSAPSMSALYESVNANRQETCQLCEKVVYLAERMQVESMFVHKNCFRCAYCSQPLRIGECGKDKDLEYHYPRRFFCKTHLRLPLKEKIARIERSARLQEKYSNRDEESSGISREISLPVPLNIVAPKEAESSSGSLVQCTATLSFFSPEHLRDRTVQKMRDNLMGGPISPVSEVPSIDDRTPERAEFSNHLRKSSAASNNEQVPPQAESDSLSSSSDFEAELEECGRSSPEAFIDADASISEEEGDELEEGDLEELERTVLQYSEENPDRPLTEAQLDSFHTPMERFARGTHGDDPGGSELSPDSPPVNNVESDIFSTPSEALLASDIKKKKADDLERLRTESRLKARLKTDEELGLESTKEERRSIPVTDFATPTSTRPAATQRDERMVKEEVKERVEHSSESHPTGLLSRLVIPESTNKTQPEIRFNPNDVVHSESRKETSILANSLRRFKMRRAEVHTKDAQSSSSTSSTCTSPHPTNAPSGADVENREVPFAAVAPSPRLDADEGDSSPHISVNERNIRLFHRRAEKIRRQHDDERRRGAQEIQRGLQECEIRLEEIKTIGQSLELKLIEDPENAWAMDSWFALVHERELLKSKEEMLRLSKREVELEVKYRDLNLRFKQLGEGMNDNLTANVKLGVIDVSDLLAAMLAVVEEKKEVNRLCESAKQSYKMINANMKALREKGRNFERFRPVFSSQ
ncbi:LIM domain protein [Teladorsagia circumcincta]|uniref:LIM domain protein n=1 Tax=Teladorsagia circumcincta TaxID=45464 RepID=A0A2G9U4I8_TELCI|nr:LIM domain protein [Teladorsagia circumcincta]